MISKTSRISWEQEAVTITAEEAMAPVDDSEGQTALEDAKAFLEDLPADGPVSSKQIRADAEAPGYSWATIRRAQKALRVVPEKEGMKGPWLWKLPPKVLNDAEDAHSKKMSTFGQNEQLREKRGWLGGPTMNPAIAIRRTSDGRIQARRIDGKPLSGADREEARRMALIEEIPPRAWLVEEVRDGGQLKAVKICSAVLEDHLWVVIDGNYQPTDGLAIYYPEEFSELSSKTPDQLREIHRRQADIPRSAGDSGRGGEAMSDTSHTVELALEVLLRRIVREEIATLKTDVKGQDHLLDAEETAKLLSVSEDWLYRHAKKLPFTRKLGPKMLRFSFLAIQKYLATRKIP